MDLTEYIVQSSEYTKHHSSWPCLSERTSRSSWPGGGQLGGTLPPGREHIPHVACHNHKLLGLTIPNTESIKASLMEIFLSCYGCQITSPAIIHIHALSQRWFQWLHVLTVLLKGVCMADLWGVEYIRYSPLAAQEC